MSNGHHETGAKADDGKKKLTFFVRVAYAAAWLPVLLPGCVHEDKPPASPLSYLNGETYAPAQPTIVGVPWNGQFERIDHETIITGTLKIGDLPVLPTGLRFAPVVLLRGSEVLGRTTVDSHGDFELSVRIPDGPYTVALQAPPWRAERAINVLGYEVKGVRLEAPLRTEIKGTGVRP